MGLIVSRCCLHELTNYLILLHVYMSHFYVNGVCFWQGKMTSESDIKCHSNWPIFNYLHPCTRMGWKQKYWGCLLFGSNSPLFIHVSQLQGRDGQNSSFSGSCVPPLSFHSLLMWKYISLHLPSAFHCAVSCQLGLKGLKNRKPKPNPTDCILPRPII